MQCPDKAAYGTPPPKKNIPGEILFFKDIRDRTRIRQDRQT